MFEFLRRLRRPPPIPDPLWRDARDAVPWARALDAAREARLRELVARFLHEKAISPIGELALDPRQRCMLAMLCCLPLLEFGAEGLRGWSQLIVYPDAFRVNRSHTDAAGVLHEWQDELIGEAWEAGPMILSWADVLADCEQPRAGFCVAAHEMAHKLDALDGLLDGTPALPRPWQREWAREFQQAYDDFCAQVDAGHDTAIDPYAAEAPEEFFAVATEYHFSDPELLQAQMPAVAAQLRRFYGSSPFA
ncbi:zinc-dependent peptidase [Lysobacter sp. 5GHs7-4]|uniref:M90 family metallopeptidase n=1 Tax=Lysobacter sp. 5GHs7-4 TaxID=2904253 RepID=UPI001E52A5FF|nr:M90 family metallopeptidase [Lysobacter sp. 5GHs7-4]UHQ22776.1 zinc-dependent peptidase [Lysobacter sp. 5GHs7-4]